MIRLLAGLVGWLAAGTAVAATLLVFGDSLAAGYGLPQGTGWVHLLEQRIEKQGYDYKVINASISGETATGGRQRIGPALATHRPEIVILELGANDGLRGQPLSGIEQNLAAIIQACREQGARVLLVGVQIPPNYGARYAQGLQAIYPTLAKRYRLPLVPFLLEGFAQRREFFQADGLHPTAEAQPLVLENVWRPLARLLRPARRAP